MTGPARLAETADDGSPKTPTTGTALQGKRIAVTGGRGFWDQEVIGAVLDRLRPTEVCHGAAKGCDTEVGIWANGRRVPVQPFPVTSVEWKRSGRGAGPRRNRRMLDAFKPDLLLAFPGGAGTRDCVTSALERHIPVYLVYPVARRIARITSVLPLLETE